MAEQDNNMPAESSPKRKHSRKPKPARLPQYNVILINDDDHTHEYVVEMLQSIFGYPVEMGFKLADDVDRRGKVVVFTAHKEHAELKKEFIDEYGIDPRVEECKGSMTSVVEPADDEG